MQDKLQSLRNCQDKTALAQEIERARKAFDNVVYAYAITVHKSQGSTFERVFIDVENICRSNIQQKMLYTAITRASKSIFVYCSPMLLAGANNDDFIDLDTLFD